MAGETAAAVMVAAIEEHRESAGRFLEAAREAVHRDHPELVVTTGSVEEPADEALPAASRTARLLVVGCDDVTVTGAVLVGSTTLATLARSACPAVAWRGARTAAGDQPVVVGVDGSALDGGDTNSARGAVRFDPAESAAPLEGSRRAVPLRRKPTGDSERRQECLIRQRHALDMPSTSSMSDRWFPAGKARDQWSVDTDPAKAGCPVG